FVADARGLARPILPPADSPSSEHARDIAPELHTPPMPSSVAEQRSRARLIRDVRLIWIDGVLRRSLHDQALIDLGMVQRADLSRDVGDAVFPWQLRDGPALRESQPFSANTRLVDVFDRYQAELLILGAPGSGKTTMLLDLAHTLLDRAEHDARRPIPAI